MWQVIYREPGIDSDVFCYCAPSMGTYATIPPPPSPRLPHLGTHFSPRETILQSITSSEDHVYSLVEGQGSRIQSREHSRVNTGRWLLIPLSLSVVFYLSLLPFSSSHISFLLKMGEEITDIDH